MKHRYFIFDLDGTIAYTLEDLKTSINLAMKDLGFPEVSLKTTLDNINFGAYALLNGCLPEEHRSPDTAKCAVEAFTRHYSQHYLDKTCAYPGVTEGIAALKAAGCLLAVYTNKPDNEAKAISARLFPKDTFLFVIGQDGTFPHKPSPEGAWYIAEQFGARPEEVVLIGDSDVDMRLAANAGMIPVGVDWGYRPASLLRELGARRILTDGKELISLIDGIDPS